MFCVRFVSSECTSSLEIPITNLCFYTLDNFQFLLYYHSSIYIQYLTYIDTNMMYLSYNEYLFENSILLLLV